MKENNQLIEIITANEINGSKVTEAINLILKIGAQKIEEYKLVDQFITDVILSDNIDHALEDITRNKLCDISDVLRKK